MHKKNPLFIVGGGPSLKEFNFTRLSGKDTIVINDSVFNVPNPNYFITMDYTWLIKNGILLSCPNQQKFLSEGIHKVFVVSFAGDPGRCKWVEGGVVDKKFDLEYDLTLFDQVVPSARYGGIGLDFSDFRTGSDSGFSALQLGVILGYKKIYLLGMDLSTVREHPAEIPIEPEPVPVWVSIKRKRSLPKPIIAIHSRNRSHYNKTMSKSNVRIFEEKLKEYLIPYPIAFQEISEKTDCEIFSCSPISKLNEHIPYVDVEEVLEDED